MLNDKIFKNEEKVAYTLRSIYSRFGYTRYKMSKFEEYDLYVRNKDFLISDGIITFTDTNGKLLALKPDVTLSIIKNSKDESGLVQKLYYDEKVYRITKGSHSFKEITQTGLECIGDIDSYDICEVLTLAVKSLQSIDKNYILDLCDAALTQAILCCVTEDTVTRKKVLNLINSKNGDEIKSMATSGEITEKAGELLLCLTKNYKCADDLKQKIESLTDNEDVLTKLDEFVKLYDILKTITKTANLRIDFSIVDDIKYYSGIVFKGYVNGIPSTVLSGGQYDNLMKKMGKNSKAIGFAVYLDVLDRLGKTDNEYDYDFVVLKDENTDPCEIIRNVEAISENGSNVIVLSKIPESIKYRGLINLKKED